MRKRVSILTSLALCISAFVFAAPVSANPFANTCVTQYEYANGWNGGDRWTECSTLIGDADYRNNTNGLHGGCESSATWPATQGSWHDCVSSFKIDNLPAGYKVQFYRNINYGFENRCIDANGDTLWNFNGLENDQNDSYRILSGNC